MSNTTTTKPADGTQSARKSLCQMTEDERAAMRADIAKTMAGCNPSNDLPADFGEDEDDMVHGVTMFDQD